MGEGQNVEKSGNSSCQGMKYLCVCALDASKLFKRYAILTTAKKNHPKPRSGLERVVVFPLR